MKLLNQLGKNHPPPSRCTTNQQQWPHAPDTAASQPGATVALQRPAPHSATHRSVTVSVLARHTAMRDATAALMGCGTSHSSSTRPTAYVPIIDQ
jgi:hypothetical protein